MNATQSVRTRFAPSPTGPMTLGNVRAALYPYLFAKQHGGSFIVRVEDTDRERSEERWERDLMENLEWLGIVWDEGPEPGGEERGAFGPYRQSKRRMFYREHAERLLQADMAYECFCTKEELDAQKRAQASIGEPPRYPGTCSRLAADERERKRRQGRGSVLRFRTPAREVVFEDMVRNEVRFDASLFGDFVFARSLEDPLYNFAAVVDDALMEVTHVIRGEEHLANTPRQILLLEALGFARPAYAHLPLILGTDRKKLSKRHGTNSVAAFREQGYLPEAVVNLAAFLGWNPGDTREIFSLKELVEEFSMKRVQKGAAIFNPDRLDWLNGSHIRKKSAEEVADLCLPFLERAGLVRIEGDAVVSVSTDERFSRGDVARMTALYQERFKRLGEAPDLMDFFFLRFPSYEPDLLFWKDAEAERTKHALEHARELLEGLSGDSWSRGRLEGLLLPEAERMGNRGYMLWPLRAALTGKRASAGPFETAEVLGKDKVIERIHHAEQKLGV